MTLKCRKPEQKSPGSSLVLSLHRRANPGPLVWAMWGLVFREFSVLSTDNNNSYSTPRPPACSLELSRMVPGEGNGDPP